MPRSIPNRLTMSLLAALAVVLTLNSAHAQILGGEKEIMRKYRVQWLTMKKYTPIVENKRVQSYVACVANRIIAVLDPEFQDLSWEVIVFDDDTTNAQVLPGGKIAVYSGILEVADTPESLAAVIGHETAHLTQNHVMQRERAYARRDMLVGVGNAATGLGGILQGASDLALMLPYQREQETEADLVGIEYMAKAGFDPRAAIYLWKRMDEKHGGRAAEYISTHPAPGTRMEEIAHNLAPALIEYNKQRDAGNVPQCAM